jgi:hypothetical protein
MDTLLAWLRDRRHDAETLVVRNDQQRRDRYCQYMTERPPKAFAPRKLPDLQAGNASQSRVPGWTILKLPAELRILIWKHAFAGKLIALNRDHEHLTHTLIDDHNSHDVMADDAVTLTSIQDMLKSLPGKRRNQKQSTRSTTLGVLALLQSCRTM